MQNVRALYDDKTPAGVPADADPNPHSRRPKLIVAGACASLLLLGLAYGIGRLETAGRIEALQKQANQKLAEERSKLNDEQRTLATRARRLELLEARRELSRASIALARRNFGTAQDLLQSASKRLGKLAGGESLKELSRDVALFKTLATEDPQAQRDVVDAYCERLDLELSPAG